jgi:hypothetical protein
MPRHWLCDAIVTAAAHSVPEPSPAPRWMEWIKTMSDLLFLSVTLAFFLVSIAYNRACQKLRGGAND